MASSYVAESDMIHRYENGFAAVMDAKKLEAVRNRDEVEFVEANILMYASESQFSPPSWGLPRISQEKFINTNIYEYPDKAGEGVDVYVIDTGINIRHFDFEGRAIWGYTAPAGDSDSDGNGHGSHVASTVAGKKYGVAKKAKVIAVKVLRSSGSGTLADVIAGVEWAYKQANTSKNPSVANMSLGGGRSPALDRAVETAIQKGLQFAVAAGNENSNACYSSPARVRAAVTVGASTKDDKTAYFSNWGDCVDLYAPGQDITGAWKGFWWSQKTISGTSMASPHVAGVMALLLAEREYSPEELKAKVLSIGVTGLLSGVPYNTTNLLLNNGFKY
jgi:cerevisin